VRTRRVRNQAEDAAAFESNRGQRVECEGGPRPEIKRQQERLSTPIDRQGDARQDAAGQQHRDEGVRPSNKAVYFAARQIVLKICEVVDDTNVGGAGSEGRKRQQDHRPQRNHREFRDVRGRVGGTEYWSELIPPPFGGPNSSPEEGERKL